MWSSGPPDPAPQCGSLAPWPLARPDKHRGSPRKGELLLQGQTEPKGWEREEQGRTCPGPSSKLSVQVREWSEARGVNLWGEEDGSKDREGVGAGLGREECARQRGGLCAGWVNPWGLRRRLARTGQSPPVSPRQWSV